MIHVTEHSAHNMYVNVIVYIVPLQKLNYKLYTSNNLCDEQY